MVATFRSAAPAEYYFQSVELMAKRELASGIWLACCRKLGAEPGDIVSRSLLGSLLTRRTGDGKSPIFGASDKSSGRDLVFSAPKSVSVVWALGDEDVKKGIEEAQYAAVKATVEVLMKEACRERRGKGGKVLQLANGAAALFTHATSRAARHPQPEGGLR